MVECQTKKPGALQTWVQFTGVARVRDFLPELAVNADSLSCLYSSRRHHKNIAHTLAAMGSVALAATVWPPYPCEVTPVSPLRIMKR